MPNRDIKESALSSQTLFQLSDGAERLFWRMTLIADDYGRFEADPQILKSRCFPRWSDKSMPPSRVKHLYAELVAAGLVVSYAVDGRQYGYFPTWEKHQGKPRAKFSKYPEPTPERICPHLRADVTRLPADGPVSTSSRLLETTETTETSGSRSFAASAAKGVTIPEAEGIDDVDFDRFWRVYPRKDNKAGARKTWGALRPDAALAERIIAAAESQKTWPDRGRDNFRYWPYAERWLKNRRWEDEEPSQGTAVSNGTRPHTRSAGNAESIAEGVRRLQAMAAQKEAAS